MARNREPTARSRGLTALSRGRQSEVDAIGKEAFHAANFLNQAGLAPHQTGLLW